MDVSGFDDMNSVPFEMNDTINRLEMATLAPEDGISADNLTENLDRGWFYPSGYGEFAGGGGTIYSDVYINGTYYGGWGSGQALAIDGQEWGMWTNMQYGGYYKQDGGGNFIPPTPSNDWIMALTDTSAYSDPKVWAVAGNLGGAVGGEWSDRRISGDVAGAWVSINDALTGVLGGQVAGTFDPRGATWEMVAIGGIVETDRFLQMVNGGTPSAADAAVLNALNIPYAEVGRTDLVTTTPDPGFTASAVTMYDTTFFSYSTGAKPRIFASGDVVGTNPSGSPGWTVGLSSSGGTANVTADFTMQQYSGGTWSGTVYGNGSVGGVPLDPAGFEGGAAGLVTPNSAPPIGSRHSGNIDFHGTAAGVVNPPKP